MRVTIAVLNEAPVFSQDHYVFNIPLGADGVVAAQSVGTVAATDPEGDTVSYSLLGSDPGDVAGRLFMVGDSGDALYTVDAVTGAISRVGSAEEFGAGVTVVRGLGHHNHELYLVGGTASAQDGIYAVNTLTGVAKRVARMTDLGSGYRALTAITSHAGALYVASSHSGTGRLFRIDLQAGTAVQVGGDNFGSANENTPTGLASHDDRLYMVGASTDKLYEIDPDTGAAVAVGSVSGFDVAGGGEYSPSGLVSHEGELYMVGDGHDRLYVLDTDTGAAVP